MTTPLWNHQAEAVAKLAPAGNGALIMDMGDGKTRTALEFVRECTEAAAGTSFHGSARSVYFGGTARETEILLRDHGKQVQVGRRGDIVCFNRGNAGKWGHIGIVRDGKTFYENTSSPDRGPGFVISSFGEIGWGRISGYYRVLPARRAAEAVVGRPVKIIRHGTEIVLAQYVIVPNGNHLDSQGKLYVE